MAEKSAKKKTKKAAKTEHSVLGNLSPTRPTRLGGERRATARGAAATGRTAAKAKTTRQPARTDAAATAKTSAPKRSAAKTSAPKDADTKAAKLRKPAPAPPAGWQTPDENGRRESGPPRGTEIVTTAVQAAGELAQIGVTLGGQLLKRAAGRLPRP
jgi:hypothetical protein